MIQELIKNFSDLPKIYAVDFDGTIVEDAYPDIGKPNVRLIQKLKELQEDPNVRLILWTCRSDDITGRNLSAAVEFCESQGIKFDAINENVEEAKQFTQNDTRKVYADYYIDDKAVNVSSFEVCNG